MHFPFLSSATQASTVSTEQPPTPSQLPETLTPPPSGLTQGPSPIRPSTERLGMSLDQRILLGSFSAFLCGFTLGSSHAGHMAALRFRAENAHRLPVSQPGWYLYQKSKNYYRMRAGVTEGMRKGVYIAAWASIFFIVEESMDVFRGTWRAGRTIKEMEGVDELDLSDMNKSVEFSRDFISTSMAGMVMGGLWSVWNHFPAVTAARTMRIGLVAGLGYGLLQDGTAWVRRNGVGWVNREDSWIFRGARNKEKRKGVEEVEQKS
ncbi:uncharacterized protein BDR25DRAFT_304578 [Lindgomyces ingoldianus]|uniref:Uncharacterized protein n=1 Tax=Lindgomyces ingoldianus TaxID=673940 RepID=A0ACB6QSF5_9PLEO|nr:uncharacterized protein BDR25DRAFT_304578 [Lindgomyces ingoldianus]KAF2469012.1 hypothetical protein BDR25DRAFT_304578 [Lindgomyces ingoldianus]